MLNRLITTHLRRTSLLVLAAWLCVCMVSIWAPMARAQISQQHVVHLCSGELAPLDAPSPLTDTGQGMALHHTLDCPLCLPVLAPPPQQVQAASVQVPAAQPQALPPAVHIPCRVALPPVRAPPSKTWILS
ncbi:hypothetical protein [Comamonas kerstersii]|uniref:DUF2946 domain-containing protein n=1 Tax=Comamonas kerstersii TaxID=225992 RepID=A0A6A1R0A7_9BURK|nr:hypothetical protein [Comamonas kerstersii]KAB0585684.1 hypothetical protein F7P80_13210 [Comamonas kerstersii]QTW19013.1 hypothetical protein H8N02_00525 [Comamonas kerstersii]